MIYLSFDELLHVARRVVGVEVVVRDPGLLDSAARRPATTLSGGEAYPGLHAKAAALAHSLARHRALVGGDTGLALGGLIAFYGVNGVRLTLTNDQAHELITDIAAGRLDDVAAIATVLREGTSGAPARPDLAAMAGANGWRERDEG